jgi:hypothetical protein
MEYLASIVLGYKSTQIVCDPNVEMLAVEAFQNVEVFHVPTLARQQGAESNRLQG